jgi:hypothetical protein
MPLPRAIAEQEFLALDEAIVSPKETTSTTAEPPSAAEPGALFISYSHKDREWLDEIQHAISKARVAILLVSPAQRELRFYCQHRANLALEGR